MCSDVEGKVFAFRFRCARCGSCCSEMPKGVPLYHGDIEGIARRIGIPTHDFVADFCDVDEHRIESEEKGVVHIPVIYLKTSDGKCVFFKEKGCSVHEVKPYNCKAAPFISLVFQSESWIRSLKHNCKGYGRGPFYTKRRIRQQLEEEAKLEEAEWAWFDSGYYDRLIQFSPKGG